MPETAERTVLGLASLLREGKISSRALVEEALASIADRTTFISLAQDAKDVADAQDKLRRAGYVASPLAGLPVSVKDLFDVAGERTLAGSKALDDRPPATQDAAVVARLKAAGAVIIGRTNMTEFAYSGVGINPHYGTPGNPYDRARIPGGSSAGAGVSVTDGSSIVAIGTDTGGSVRIPAALCGVVGWKPTARRVPTSGAVPLSTTLDSVGPLARSVACCTIADAVLAGETPVLPPSRAVVGLRFAVPQTFVVGGVDDQVAAAFSRALSALSRAGARVTDIALDELSDYSRINAGGGFSPPEAYAWHRDLLTRRGADYDPRVRRRIEGGRDMSAADYVTLIAERARFIARIDAATADYDALLWPTVPIVAPPISAFAEDAEFFRLNGLILRNAAIVNFLDRCALSLPVERAGEPPVGLMLVGRNGEDRTLLGMGLGIEAALASSGA